MSRSDLAVEGCELRRIEVRIGKAKHAFRQAVGISKKAGVRSRVRAVPLVWRLVGRRHELGKYHPVRCAGQFNRLGVIAARQAGDVTRYSVRLQRRRGPQQFVADRRDVRKQSIVLLIDFDRIGEKSDLHGLIGIETRTWLLAGIVAKSMTEDAMEVGLNRCRSQGS